MDDTSIISLIVAVIIGFLQIQQGKRMEAFEKRQDERDERRRKDEIYAEATRFIQKYNKSGHESEIYLLPLCIAAYKYDHIYSYRREIYREFCGLPEDVQNSVLKRCKINIPCHKSDNYFQTCLDKLCEEIKEYCPGDEDFFHANGKYLEWALKNHGEKEIPNIRCEIDEREQEALNHQIGANSKSSCRNDMDFKEHITNLLAYEVDKQPIYRLARELTNLGRPTEAEEILICYLCCIIAEYVPYYLYNNSGLYENTGDECDYTGTRYMEDAFLNALHSITVHGSNKGQDEP